MVWALIVMFWAYRRGFYYIGGFYKIWLNLCTKHDGLVAIEKTGKQFFPRFILTVCKLQPEILINIMKYPLIVKMYNQCIFYNIENLWLKLTHCEVHIIWRRVTRLSELKSA